MRSAADLDLAEPGIIPSDEDELIVEGRGPGNEYPSAPAEILSSDRERLFSRSMVSSIISEVRPGPSLLE